ncbi:MAG TPA: hypothetical protein VHO70_17260, partial [Chitinispirillaceae bacterium]|nr:hypothetical protein [Chitinispirillaceae bacterium]
MKKLTLISLFASLTILTYSQTLTVYFKFNESLLDDKSISSISDLIKTNKPKGINLAGFADTIGTVDYNKILVQKRLVAVENTIL